MKHSATVGSLADGDANVLQVTEMIAGWLPTNKDLRTFMLLSKATHAAVTWRNSGVWRVQFCKRFDMPDGMSSNELKLKYKELCVLIRYLETHLKRERTKRNTRATAKPNMSSVVALIQGETFRLLLIVYSLR